MNIKIPRVVTTTFSNGCIHCSHYTRYTKTSGFCNKHLIYLPPDRLCDDYDEAITPTVKSNFTTNNKLNIENIVKEYLGENKIVVEIDAKDFLKSVKKGKVYIKDTMDRAGIIDKFYVTARLSQYHQHNIIIGERYCLVGSIYSMPWEDFAYCKGNANLFDWRNNFLDEMYRYLYETYK